MRYKKCFWKRSKRLQRNVKNIFCCFKKLFTSHTVPLLRQMCVSCTWMLIVYHKCPSDTYVTNKYTVSPNIIPTALVWGTTGGTLAQSGGSSSGTTGPYHSAPAAELGPCHRPEHCGLQSWRMPRRYFIAFNSILFCSSKQDLWYVSGAFDSIWWIDPEDFM